MHDRFEPCSLAALSPSSPLTPVRPLSLPAGCAQLRLETAPALNSRVPTPAQRAVQWRRQQRRSGSGGLAAAAPRAMTVAAAPAARVSAEDKWIERTLEAVVLDSASLPAP